MVAAAVGITSSSHEATTTVGKINAQKSIAVTAENTGNFNTMGTGAAMSLAKNANAIAMGVAVSVNSNKSGVTATGDIVSLTNEDVTVTSKLTQNMDGEFAGKLAAQSLSGSIAGEKSGISLAGAVSVVVSKASSTVDIAAGTQASPRTIQGGEVTVEATDKSKLAARAGGLSISKGSAVGAGIGSTTIVSSNTVSAAIGDWTNVNANSFTLNAEKKEVTYDDYKSQVNLRTLVTDSSELDDKERKNSSQTGLIDFHKGKDDKNYKVEVNLTTDRLLDAVDGLNFLSSQNTDAEAIAGAVGGTTSLSGSFAVAVSSNRVNTTMGRNVHIKAATGNVAVNAANGNTARIIAGAVSVAGKSGAGVTVAVMVNSDEVKNESGADSDITAAGDITRNAEATGDQQVFTMAAAIASEGKDDDDGKDGGEGGEGGQGGGNNVPGSSKGGAVNVIVNRTIAKNIIGINSVIVCGFGKSERHNAGID